MVKIKLENIEKEKLKDYLCVILLLFVDFVIIWVINLNGKIFVYLICWELVEDFVDLKEFL